MNTDPAENDRPEEAAGPDDASGGAEWSESPRQRPDTPFSAEHEARVCEVVLGDRRHGL